MRLLVRHMQGLCVGETKKAVMLTDSVDTPTLDFWRQNLRRIAGAPGDPFHRRRPRGRNPRLKPLCRKQP